MRQPSERRDEDRDIAFRAGGDVARELITGLEQAAPRIAPKFFYDPLGSRLFEAICQLDEYYLTRAEAEIFATRAGAIAEAAGEGGVLIDLGAGNCAKAAGLFAALKPRQYVPIDISVAFLLEAVERLRAANPDLAVLPVGLDFTEGLALPPRVKRGGRLFFYPGSSIGNFAPLHAARFLRRVRDACGGDGGILIGVDLAKDAGTLEAAYDDALGVTSAFNLNVLRHVNALAGSDFDPRGWRHRALYNAGRSRVEMYLEAIEAQTVRWPGGSRHFASGSRIHTENSYKYTADTFGKMLEGAGFQDVRSWTDGARRFLVCHARAG